jgi:hypothetical protein
MIPHLTNGPESRHLASFEWCGIISESFPPVKPDASRSQSIAIFLDLSTQVNSSEKLSASGTTRVSDRVTACCHSALALLQLLIQIHSGTQSASRGGIGPRVSQCTRACSMPWSSREECLHALNLHLAGLGPPEEAVKDIISRFIYALPRGVWRSSAGETCLSTPFL